MIGFRPDSRWGMLLLLAMAVVFGLNPAFPTARAAPSDIYYVSPNGDDSNPGSVSQPWGTIQYAIDNVGPGDTIMVRGGTYNEGLEFHISGQDGSPITLAPYEGEAVTIDGDRSPAILDVEGTQYWIVEGFILDSDAEQTILFDAWMVGTHHWIIRNNTIIGAVKIHGSYNLFESNEVDGSQHKGSEDGVEDLHDLSHHNTYRNNHIHHFNSRGIWSRLRTHHNIIEDNHVHHIQGQAYSMGIDLDGYGNVVWTHIVRRNHVHDCDQAGIEIENAFNVVVENNIVHDCGIQGINVINYAGCEQGGGYGGSNCLGLLTGNVIRQNLIYRCGIMGGVVSQDAGGIKVWGNTIYRGRVGVGFYHETPGCEIRGNIIHGNTEDDIRAPADTVIDHSLFADPLFVDPSRDDFHLQASSPAIDGGIDIELATDLDGNPRPQGAGYDVGAYEYNGGVQPSPTPTLPPAPQPTSTPTPPLTPTPQPTSTPTPPLTPTPQPTSTPTPPLTPTPQPTSTPTPPLTPTPQPTSTPTPTLTPTPLELIIDNSDSEFSTNFAQDVWQKYAQVGGQHYGDSHYYNNQTGVGEDTATWSFGAPQPGKYEVYAWWWEGSRRPSDVPYTVNHLGGSTIVRVNQQTNGGQWNLLGTFDFQDQGSVVVSDDVSSGWDVVADALRLVYVGPLVSPTQTPDLNERIWLPLVIR